MCAFCRLVLCCYAHNISIHDTRFEYEKRRRPTTYNKQQAIFISIITHLIYEYNPLSCNRFETWRKCVFVSFNRFIGFISSFYMRHHIGNHSIAIPLVLSAGNRWYLHRFLQCGKTVIKSMQENQRHGLRYLQLLTIITTLMQRFTSQFNWMTQNWQIFSIMKSFYSITNMKRCLFIHLLSAIDAFFHQFSTHFGTILHKAFCTFYWR